MSELNKLVKDAEQTGRYAANLAHELGKGVTIAPDTDSHHPGDDTGRIVVKAFREHGEDGVRNVAHGYERGYNERSQHHGDTPVTREQIKNGMPYALAGVTKTEESAILSAL